jgi:hypothetical protein
MATISDIQAEARALVDADTTSYPAADLLRRCNHAYEQVIGWLIDQDGTWQFDDSNYTTVPRGLGLLVEGQEAYKFASRYLDVEAIDILDTASPAKYRRIKPLDLNDLGGLSPEDYFGLTSAGNPAIGFPNYYDIQGDFIRLYPAPTSTSVTLTDGIRVWFKRTADLFTSAQVTTGTKEPGFESTNHYILSYMAAIPYALSYKKDRVASLEKKVMEMKAAILKHSGHREADRRKVMTMKKINYI